MHRQQHILHHVLYLGRAPAQTAAQKRTHMQRKRAKKILIGQLVACQPPKQQCFQPGLASLELIL
ncbi:hypothetical protein D9M71_747360 [compost metagenome]